MNSCFPSASDVNGSCSQSAAVLGSEDLANFAAAFRPGDQLEGPAPGSFGAQGAGLAGLQARSDPPNVGCAEPQVEAVAGASGKHSCDCLRHYKARPPQGTDKSKYPRRDSSHMICVASKAIPESLF